MSERGGGTLSTWRLRDVESVPVERGEFERLAYENGVLVASGWLHVVGKVTDSFALYSGSTLGAVVPPLSRPDVRAVFGEVMPDDRSGFHAAAHVGAPEGPGWLRFHVVGFSGDRPVGRATTIFIPGFADGLPVPPAHLMQRVSNNTSVEIFRIGGLRTAGIFFEAILRHADEAGVNRLLDWGSGCGRVSSFFIKYSKTARARVVAGCDIDAEAVEWCRRNLPGGRFVTIRPDPPTPFEAGEFDAIAGYSVMTHLDRNSQIAWLRELKRLLRPGGLVLVSVHGESAARYAKRRDLMATLSERGIVDEIDDLNLEGVAPKGYYRETYQTRAWTEATWGREMEVVEYADRGMGGFQDLVVLRKR